MHIYVYDLAENWYVVIRIPSHISISSNIWQIAQVTQCLHESLIKWQGLCLTFITGPVHDFLAMPTIHFLIIWSVKIMGS